MLRRLRSTAVGRPMPWRTELDEHLAARTSGAAELFLQVTADDEPAVRLRAGCGFESSHESTTVSPIRGFSLALTLSQLGLFGTTRSGAKYPSGWRTGSETRMSRR